MFRQRARHGRTARLSLARWLVVAALMAAACGRAPDEAASAGAGAHDQTAAAADEQADAALAAEVARRLAAGDLPAVGGAVGPEIQAFYTARDGQPAWATAAGPTDRVAAVLTLIRHAADHGLTPADYGLARATTLRDALCASTKQPGGVSVSQLAELEILLTSALLAFGHDVAMGRVTPEAFSDQWRAQRAPPDLAGSLADAVDQTGPGSASLDLEGWIRRIAPPHPEYEALRQTLVRLRAGIGSPHESFPAATALEQTLALNLDRWRWMPDDPGPRHVLVNIPEYHLYVREAGRTVLDMRAIVGKAGVNETPIFSSALTTIVFSPYWYIPDTIALNETIPTFVRDPGYLERVGIEVLRVGAGGATTRVDPASIDWRDPTARRGLVLRQRPGAVNALGHVKFLFPNPYSVYLHDTPADELFARDGRALSHGCIRLAAPADLAAWLLRDRPEWTPARMAAAMSAGTPETVTLADRVPLHVVYFTAWPDGHGGARVFDDVYGLAARHLTARREAAGRE